MSKLLSFYIPIILKESTRFYLFTTMAISILYMLPFSEGAKNLIAFAIVFLILPCSFYFNRTVYLPDSIHWILLTPIKKSHIILSHGLINILKVVLNILFCSVFLLIFNELSNDKSALSFPDSIFDENSPSESIVISVIFMALVFSLIFGILPNYLQRMQAQSIQPIKSANVKKRTFKEKAVLFGYCSIIIIGLYLIFSSDEIVLKLFPPALKLVIGVGLGLAIVVYSTLQTLKAYYSQKKTILGLATVTILILMIVFKLSFSIINGPKASVITLMDYSDFMGSFANDLDKKIFHQLLNPNIQLTDVKSSHLKEYFELPSRRKRLKEVESKWTEICTINSDYRCRLANYAHFLYSKEKQTSYLLAEGCKNDLRSCYELYFDYSATSTEKNIAKNGLEGFCQGNETKDCKTYRKYVPRASQ